VRVVTNRCGLIVLGQRRARSSSHARRRTLTGSASGMVRPSRWSRPSMMSVSRSWRTCRLVRAWNATSATASAVAGSGESRASRMASGVERERHRLLDSCALHAASGVEEDQLAGFDMLNSDRSPSSTQTRREPAGGNAAVTCSGGDLGQRGVPVGCPVQQDRCGPQDVNACGLWVAFASPR
jgi:hypothetical protein